MLKVFWIPVVSLILLVLINENNISVGPVDLVHKVRVHLLLVLNQYFDILEWFDHVDYIEFLLYFVPPFFLHLVQLLEILVNPVKPVAADEALAVISRVDVLDPEKVFISEKLNFSLGRNYYVSLLFELVLLLSKHVKMLFVILVKFESDFFFRLAIFGFGPSFLFE